MYIPSSSDGFVDRVYKVPSTLDILEEAVPVSSYLPTIDIILRMLRTQSSEEELIPSVFTIIVIASSRPAQSISRELFEFWRTTLSVTPL